MTTLDRSTDVYADRQIATNFGEHGLGITISRKVSYSDFAASGDVVKVITIPANSFVANLYAFVKTAWDGTAVLIVGDGNTTNGYMVDTEINEPTINTLNDLNATSAAGAFAALAARPFYTTADTIDVTLTWSTTPSAGVLYLIAEIVTIP